MKIMQIAKTKGLNLSVTIEKRNYTAIIKRAQNTFKNDKHARVDASLHEIRECSGGICQVTWKPLQHTA